MNTCNKAKETQDVRTQSLPFGEVRRGLFNEMVVPLQNIQQINPIPYPTFCNIGSGGQEANLFFYHPDHLGSTGMVTDNNANVTQGFIYSPFGELIYEHNPSWENNRVPKYAFNAKELDEENGMYYYSARYYAPPTFISRDPMFEKYPSISPYTYCSNNPVNKIDPTGMFDDWVQGVDGTVYWDNNATSQETTKPGETYLGKEGYGTNPETGNRTHYKPDATKSEDPYSIKGVTVTAKASEHAKAMQAKRALGMHEFSKTQYGLAPDMIGIQFGAEVFDVVGGGIDITLGYMKGEGGFINIAPKYGLGVDKGSFSAGIITGYYHGKGSPSSASLAGASLFQNISVGMLNISTSVDITDNRFGKNWRTSSIGITNPSIISGSTGISITTPPILKFGGK